MKVKVLKLFYDISAKKLRNEGEVFEVAKKDLPKYNETLHGKLVEPIEESKDEKERPEPADTEGDKDGDAKKGGERSEAKK